jgi:glycyl-tRNA synthetase (class II)
MAAKKEFSREELDELLKRRFFISRSFDIYGGIAGLYDLGVCPRFTSKTFI